MAGMEIQIRFRFRSIIDLNNDYPGFYVDDVLIRGTPAEPPQIISAPITEAIVGQLYTYDVDATGKPAPVYSLDGTEPNGMAIDPNSGLISWMPIARSDGWMQAVASEMNLSETAFSQPSQQIRR